MEFQRRRVSGKDSNGFEPLKYKNLMMMKANFKYLLIILNQLILSKEILVIVTS